MNNVALLLLDAAFSVARFLFVRNAARVAYAKIVTVVLVSRVTYVVAKPVL